MIDITKTYRTRCGYPVQIYRTDARGACAVQGSIDLGENDSISHWGSKGIHPTNKELDLIEVKPRIVREVWVNVYKDSLGDACNTKKLAHMKRCEGCVACVKITIDFEEGEGLE